MMVSYTRCEPLSRSNSGMSGAAISTRLTFIARPLHFANGRLSATFGGAAVQVDRLVAALRSLLANRQAVPCPGIKMVRVIGLAVKHIAPAFNELLLVDELVPLLTARGVCATRYAFEVNDHRKRLVVDLQARLANPKAVIRLLVIDRAISKVQAAKLFKQLPRCCD